MHHLPAGTHCLANRPGTLAGGHSKLVGVGRLALPRLFGFEPNRSAIPGQPHAGRRPGTCLHPEGAAILSRRGLLFPLRPVAAKLVGMKGLAPPRLPDSESGPSAIRVEPHARENGAPGRTLTCNPAVRSRPLWYFELRERGRSDDALDLEFPAASDAGVTRGRTRRQRHPRRRAHGV